MLTLNDIVVHYGGIAALKGVSLEVPRGKIVTLIGANGAGKSTTLRTVSRLVKSRSGTISLEGKDVTGCTPKEMVEQGVILVPEGRHVFPDMTVLENLKIGAYLRRDKDIQRDLRQMQEMFPRLGERRSQLAGTLSGGEQQMLAVSRALMSRPRLLMMDEPSLGLAPLVVADIFAIVQRLNREEGMTILLIEQNANAALKIAHYGYVLETGSIGLSGTGAELLQNHKVMELYLGKLEEQTVQEEHG